MRALFSCLSSFSLNLICKISPLVSGEILGVFVNTLTDDVKYPVQDCENLVLTKSNEFFEKPKACSQLFVSFLEATSSFKHFERKIASHTQCISEITDWENLG